MVKDKISQSVDSSPLFQLLLGLTAALLACVCLFFLSTDLSVNEAGVQTTLTFARVGISAVSLYP